MWAVINVLPFPLCASLHLFLFYYIDLWQINKGQGIAADMWRRSALACGDHLSRMCSTLCVLRVCACASHIMQKLTFSIASNRNRLVLIHQRTARKRAGHLLFHAPLSRATQHIVGEHWPRCLSQLVW